jgi:hypothetical protein
MRKTRCDVGAADQQLSRGATTASPPPFVCDAAEVVSSASSSRVRQPWQSECVGKIST